MPQYNHKANTEARMVLKHLKDNQKADLYIEPVFEWGKSDDTTERVTTTRNSISAAFNVIRGQMTALGMTEKPELTTQFLLAVNGTRDQFETLSACPAIRGYQTSVHLKRR